jgi:predicted GNAT superfamily acetyltransferase
MKRQARRKPETRQRVCVALRTRSTGRADEAAADLSPHAADRTHPRIGYSCNRLETAPSSRFSAFEERCQGQLERLASCLLSR